MTYPRTFPKSVKVAAFKRADGHCEREGCTAKLMPGKFEYDHVLAHGLGGDSTLENCEVLCWPHHMEKTSKSDVPRMAKADRQRSKNIGAKTRKGRPLTHPYLKRKVSGEVVER